MNALTVIGLTANIFQFIEFGIKMVSKGNQIYRSADGRLPEHLMFGSSVELQLS